MYKFSGLLLLVLSFNVFSQSFSGKIIDKSTNQPIPYAVISLVDFDIATQTNLLGEFQFSIPLPKKIKVKISALTYESSVALYETSSPILVYLTENHLELEEIVVSNGANEKTIKNVNPLELRRMSDLKAIPTSNLGEALSTIPGVYVSSTGNGISKPVIRGLQGSRVVSYLNGLRLENQQWGGDHGMGVNDLGLDQVEIIKGPSSLQFGADALGGVVYYSDKKYANQDRQEIEIQSQLESNTLGHNNRVEYRISKNHFRFNLATLYANHADYKLPSGQFAGNSRFSEQNIKFSLAYNQKNWITHLRYNFVNNRVGIPGHSHDSIINLDDFKYNYQSRNQTIPAQLVQNHYMSLESKYFFSKGEFVFLGGQTLNSLTELEDKLTIPGIKMNLSNTLYHLKLKYNLSEKISFLTGFQGMYQQTINDPFALEFLIPSGTSLDNGLYFISFLEHKKWNFQAGLRFDSRQITSLESFKGNDKLAKSYSNLNYSAGAIRNSKNTRLRFNVSNAYRTPHFTELLSNGTHHGALRYEIGNQELVPEIASQADVLMEYHNEHLALTFNPFYNYIQNFIYVNPTDSFIGSYRVFNYEQLSQVHVSGFDFGIHYHPHFAHFLHLESSYSFINMDTKTDFNLPLIPQNRINTFVKLNFKMKHKFKLEQFVVQHAYYFEQNQVAVYETESKAYNLINLALNFKIDSKNPFYIDVAFKNILNENYINHLSRLKDIDLAHPGFNFYLSLKWNFNSELKK
jgi:iron complex outermembrane receptor protein